jgi:4-hydroxy-tetrahydrodipicolinate reductase
MKKNLKIALIGYGKMGVMIEALALKRGHTVVRIARTSKEADFKEISKVSLAGVDVAIDFSSPDSVLNNLSKVMDLKTPFVIGTTGWYGDMKKAESLIKTAKGRVVWGANFSVGMNVFMKVVRESSKLFSKFEQYGVSGLEIHHAEKKDNPSGTAIKLGQVIDSEYARGSKVKGRKQALGAAGKVTFAGVRVGSEPGTHTVLFDSAVDTVELTHRARSREGFALGAILAAEWICEQKPQFYSFENHFEDMIS